MGTRFSDYETVGYIGVDAGIVMVVDPCYMVPNDNWHEFCDEYWEKSGKTTGESGLGGIADMKGGIVVQTAWGDGLYPVSVRRDNSGRITEIRVVFDWDEV